MLNTLVSILDFLIGFWFPQRWWFWACVVVIVIGLIAIAANLMEPSHASLRGL